MRLVAISAACWLALSGIAYPMSGPVPDITNNIEMACNSAMTLLSLPTTLGAPAGSKVAVKAGKLSIKVQRYCALGPLVGGLLGLALGQVNTAAAQLLGTGVANK